MFNPRTFKLILKIFLRLGKWRISYDHDWSSMEEISRQLLRFRPDFGQTVPVLDYLRPVLDG